MEKICQGCSASFGILADYCGRCGTKLPEAELPSGLLEEKDQHNRVICQSALGHALQRDRNGKQHHCTACGKPLPVVH